MSVGSSPPGDQCAGGVVLRPWAPHRLGLGDAGGLRIGLAPYNDDSDIDRLLSALADYCLIKCRAPGMFRMTDEAGGDDKVLCVPETDPRLEHLRDINHVSRFDRLEIQQFFEATLEIPG